MMVHPESTPTSPESDPVHTDEYVEAIKAIDTKYGLNRLATLTSLLDPTTGRPTEIFYEFLNSIKIKADDSVISGKALLDEGFRIARAEADKHRERAKGIAGKVIGILRRGI